MLFNVTIPVISDHSCLHRKQTIRSCFFMISATLLFMGHTHLHGATNFSEDQGFPSLLSGCTVNGGVVSSGSQLNNICITNGSPAAVQIMVSGNTGIGRFGLVRATTLQVIASNTTGLFDMGSYPPGNYVAGHISVESLSTLSGITNVNDLSGCFHISNYLAISTYHVNGGTVMPAEDISITGGEVTWQVTGHSGPFSRWILLNGSGTEVISIKTTGTFQFDGMQAGTYRIVHVSFGPEFDTENANPQNPQGCIDPSNMVFVTLQETVVNCPAQIEDIEGHVYPVVQIGNQCWTTKNLNTSFYDNGEVVEHIAPISAWTSAGLAQNGAWCYYNNDPLNEVFHGKLYNFYAVTDTRGLCPSGWHVPTDSDYTLLTDYLGGISVAGGKMKTTGNTGAGTGLWVNPNNDATNESGFSALPGGYRTAMGQFFSIGSFGSLWSSSSENETEAWYRGLANYNGVVFRSTCEKSDGCTVRCVMD